MSLLDRAELVSATRQDTLARDDADQSANVALARRLLYEQLPSAKIAQLISRDMQLASREVRGMLDLVMRRDEFAKLSFAARRRIAGEVCDMVLGLGPLQPLLDDPDITEVIANGPAAVFYELDGKLHSSNVVFEDAEQMRAIIDRMLGPVGRRVDEQSPMVSARLPGGHRVNIVVPPLAPDGPCITIRKFRNRIFTLDELVQRDTIDASMATFLRWCIWARKNIAVSGGTGSGKTTFLNALSCELPHDQRVITIEDSAELRFDQHPDVVRLEARPKSAEGLGEVTIRDLVINALRMRPDRIVVGECRGSEALDMLQAMNTGHDGSMTTLHANSPHEVVGRLVTMVRYGSDLPTDVVEDQIASAIDLIVHLRRQRDGSRKVVEVCTCRKCDAGVELGECATWDPSVQAYVWRVPEWIAHLVDAGIVQGEEVKRWMSTLSMR